MKCPFCEKELQGTACPGCGTTSPEGARYCMECGARLFEAGPAALGEADDFDPEDRILCPDGNCTGIIMEGRCTECGRAPDGS
ncbi:MAG: hypothetical protein C4582_00230 [Desulfobacteraceae bacterium]|nr:MAG: hypothetical protein C4582_00230 [Desulfobacteraceae bacterium]